MADPWSVMEDEDNGNYSGADEYFEGDDDEDEVDDFDMNMEEEIEQLAEEAEFFQIFARGSEHRFLALVAGAGDPRIQSRLRSSGQIIDDIGGDNWTWSGRRRGKGDWFQKVTEPQPAGVKLLMSGDFGRTASRLGAIYKEDLTHDMVPNTHGTAVASYSANVYCGQYSADSSFYYTCCQDFWLHVYDTKALPKPAQPARRHTRTTGYNFDYEDDHTTTMSTIKSIRGVHGNWTITDSHLSPDNQRMIYSTMAPTVYMTYTLDSSAQQTPIPFDVSRSYGTAIWCCRFSADGNEVFAGGSGPIYVYDLISNRRTVKIQQAHHNDVNSCCWADTASGNVLISGSDDGFIKVWDRRSLGAAQKPSGVLVGHTEGITYVSAKGDGRYIISNGKDQALRLWDLRKMRTNEEFDDEIRHNRFASGYDYRHGYYPKPRILAHPQDCSVMTYRGHEVLRTLIRCHFSPMETTGAQYLYSGSRDGKIHIWSLDGRLVQVLDRSLTLPMSTDPSAPEPEASTRESLYRTQACVRDVSWHSQEPVLMSAAWSGTEGGSGSVVARHEWKGLARGGKLEDWVEKVRQEGNESDGHGRVPGGYPGD